MTVNNNIMILSVLLLIFGSVILAASTANVYYVLNDDHSEESRENDYQISSQESHDVLRLLKKIMQLFPSTKSTKNHSVNEKIKNADYDYYGYYLKDNEDKRQRTNDCEGDKCVLLIPGKTPLIIKDDEGTSEDSADKAEHSQEYDYDGYYRDDEGEVETEEIARSRCYNNQRYKYKSICRLQQIQKSTFNLSLTGNATVNLTIINATTAPATPKPFKTFDEKSTDELTSADLDYYIPDSFEERSGKDSRGKRKFSEDYINIGDLFSIAMRTNKKDHIVKVRLAKEPTSNENLDAITSLVPNNIPKELLRMLRMRPVDYAYTDGKKSKGGRKWGRVKKSWERNKRFSTSPRSVSVESDSGSYNVPAEDSDTETDSRSAEKPRQKPNKKLNRFKVVTQKTKTHRPSYKESIEDILARDTTETIEHVSEEVKPKPKKKTKPRIPGKPEHYMQSLARLYKEGKDFRKNKDLIILHDLRKRMQHFMPKRYHWDPSEFKKLGYFWFNGPQGKAPGPWKINY